MRNGNKRLNRQTREFSKVIRMNNKDYFLHSVYDGEAEIEYDDKFERELKKAFLTHTVFDEVPWYKNIRKRPKRLVEDFFDDFDDITQEIVNQEEDVLDDPYNNSYFVNLENGENVEVHFSDDNIKNAIFYLLVNFMVISDNGGDKEDYVVDDYVYSSGKMNNMTAYKVDISDIRYENGSYKIVVGGETKGFLQVYFIDTHNANFKIVFKNINVRRPGNLAVFTYQQFCNFLRCDRITMKSKTADVYYKPILRDLMVQYQKAGVNLTLCKTKNPVEEKFFGHTASEKFVPAFFKPVVKYGKTQADYTPLINLVDTDIANIENVYENDSSDLFANDDYYVLIGGNENYIRNIQSSIWGNRFNAAISTDKYIRIAFKTQDPELRTNWITHNMMLIPFSRFVAASPALLTHMF